jgi:hypothetical protein
MGTRWRAARGATGGGEKNPGPHGPGRSDVEWLTVLS